MVLMGYSGVQGTLIYEKKLKLKISCQTPFKADVSAALPFLYFRFKTLCLNSTHSDENKY